MRVILARPRGFCAGVNMAISTLEEALRLFGPPVYVYHEIVHNKYVVERFKERGAIFVDELDEVPFGGHLVFSAHGVSPEIREAARMRNLTVVDATCPLVHKVHSEAVRFARQDYTILLVGHEGHDEIIGTMGEAPGRMRLVQSAEEVDALEFDGSERLAYLSQTTLSIDDADAIIGRIKERFPEIASPPSGDICYATTNRQFAVHEIARDADVFLVIGSRNSSNSMRLREIAEHLGTPAYLIDYAEDIDPAWLEGKERVAITACASAPEHLVERTIDFLVERYGATVEEQVVREENMHFQLPVELRRLIAQREVLAS